MTRRRLLLIVCVLMVNFVIVGLAMQVGHLSTRVQELTTQQAEERARRDTALELAGQAVKRLEAVDPEVARELGVELRVVRGGDPRLLEPTAHKDLIRLFDEML